MLERIKAGRVKTWCMAYTFVKNISNDVVLSFRQRLSFARKIQFIRGCNSRRFNTSPLYVRFSANLDAWTLGSIIAYLTKYLFDS